jgi:putative transposase
MLADRIAHYEETKESLMTTPAQYKEEYPYLREVDSLALANEQINLETAYKNFFRNPVVGFPKWKKKNNYKSYTTNNQKNNIRFSKSRKSIKLPKIGFVGIRKHRSFAGTIKSCTISQEPTGKYFISILVDQVDGETIPVTGQVGLDMGLEHFVTLSDGSHKENPKYYRKAEQNLGKEQRKLSRKRIGSTNRERQRLIVAKCHEKVKNKRKDHLHKLSKSLIDENQVICLEDLNVNGMVKNKKLSKSISDAGWSEFRRMLEYKATWYGREVVAVPAMHTSQTCNRCGSVDKNNRLTQADFKCIFCNHEDNADVNAAKNILEIGLKIRTDGLSGIAC